MIIEAKATLPHNEAEHRTFNIWASFLLIKQRENMIRCRNIYFVEDLRYDNDGYKLLRKKMRTCQFKTVGFKKGCTGCKSADHDSYNCPFS